MRSRRSYRPDLPHVYLVTLAQPMVKWAGTTDASYKQTLLRPEEKWKYVQSITRGKVGTKRRQPVVFEHAGLAQAHDRPPDEAVIGDTLCGWHDQEGNVFQVLRLPTSKPRTAEVFHDLERGDKWGTSLFTNLGRDPVKRTVEELSVPHIGMTKNPAWGNVDYEGGPHQYDRGSWVRFWTQDPAELRSHLDREYMGKIMSRVPSDLRERLMEEEEATAAAATVPQQSEPPARVNSSSLTQDKSAHPGSGAAPPLSWTNFSRHSPAWISATMSDAAAPAAAAAVPVTQPATPLPAATTPPAPVQAPAAAAAAPSTPPPPVSTIVSNVEKTLKDLDNTRNASERLRKFDEVQQTIRSAIQNASGDDLLKLVGMMQTVLERQKKEKEPVGPFVQQMRDRGYITPDDAEFVLAAEKNLHLPDARIFTDMVYASARDQHDQKEAEKKMVSQIDAMGREQKDLKRKFDEADAERQIDKKIKLEQAARIEELETRLKSFGPKDLAAASAPTTPAAAAPAATAPLSLVADSVAASRTSSTSMASQMWAVISKRTDRGNIAPITKEERPSFTGVDEKHWANPETRRILAKRLEAGLATGI